MTTTQTYPDLPGFKATDTSRAAASTVPATLLHARIMVHFRGAIKKSGYNGFTADEMAAVLLESVLSIRPRFSELKRLGLIIDTRIRRKNESGKSAIVWALSPTTKHKHLKNNEAR